MPTPSRFPISSSGPTPGYLITTSAALHLGNLIHLCSRKSHLGFDALLRSSSFKNLWRGRPPLFKGVSFFEQHDPFSAAYTSCLCFFGGKKTKKDIGGEGKSNLETPKRNLFNGRLLTNVLLAANVVVYVAQLASEGKLILWGAKINSLIDKGQFWRLVTSSLLHANIGHLMVNCYSLNSVGPTVESMSGPWRFLAVYISSAIASSTMSYWFCNAPAVGASGAIFGLVGSFAVFVLRHRSIIGDRTQSLQHVAQVIALNMVIGVLSPGIDNWGHVGGLLGGAASAWLVGPAWKYESRTNDGRSVYADRAPIFYFIKKKRRMAK